MNLDIGSKISTKIIDFSSSGNGIARHDGAVIFLDSGVVGDMAEIKITSHKKNYYKGEVVEILSPSKYRKKSPCQYSEKCGGCDFLNFKYDNQLLWKKDLIKSNINKISNLHINIEDTIGMKHPYNYRNNMQFKVTDNKIGLYKKYSNDIVEINKCLIQSDKANEILDKLKNVKLPRSVHSIAIRTNQDNEAMVVFVTNSKATKFNNVISALLDINVESIYENVNTNKNRHFSNNFTKIYGKDFLEEHILGKKFKIYPESFLQVNYVQMERLYKVAIEYLTLSKSDTVLDLYCGIGTITLNIASKVKKTLGIESNSKSIDRAREGAILNNIENAEFIASRAENIVDKLLDDSEYKFSKVILDPPRAGCNKDVLDAIIKVSPEKISYISCNPSTLSRDLKILCEGGYKVEKVQPVDMFCNSAHVETVVLFTKE